MKFKRMNCLLFLRGIIRLFHRIQIVSNFPPMQIVRQSGKFGGCILLFSLFKTKDFAAARKGNGLFPFPMVPCEESQADRLPPKEQWLVAVLAALNWLSGKPLLFPHKGPMNALQSELLGNLREAMLLFCKFEEIIPEV